MFKEHQARLSAFARESAENTFRVLEFVQATINQNFYQVPNILNDLDFSGHASQLTRKAHSCIVEYSARRQEIYDTIFSDDLAIQEKLFYLVQLPGFGMVKAGFILQICLGRVGCMDTHNIRRYREEYGLKGANTFRVDCRRAQLIEKIATYVHLTESIGTEKLWNEWCHFVAARYPKVYRDGEQVSWLHIKCIMRNNL